MGRTPPRGETATDRHRRGIEELTEVCTFGKRGLDKGAEPVYTAPHVGVVGGDPNVGAGAWGHHGAQALQDDAERNGVGGAVDLDAGMG
jgi:hypothetical protein